MDGVIENINLENIFREYLESRRTDKTRVKYEHCISVFFKLMFDKEIKKINIIDLKSMHYSIVFKKYIKVQREKGIKDSTIKTSLSIVSSFFDYLNKENIFMGKINYDKIRNDYLSTSSLVDDVNHIKPMSKKDLSHLKEWLKNKEYNTNTPKIGEKYAALVDFMFVTAIRSSATFKIKWSQFEIYDSVWGGKFAKLTVIDKGTKKNIKNLQYVYFRKMKELLFSGNEDDLVFGELSKRNFIYYLNVFSKETGIEITPHSIKVGAGTYVYSITKDIVKTSRFLDHENIETTMRYIRDNGNPNESGSVIASRDYDYDKLDGLSKEQLLSIVKSREELKNIIYTDSILNGFIKE
ncbi:tyrosine-type recombinase/integrase [Liquorilactobacillus hordei]|uniref:Phage integrase n=1 Tax=Liquorilactobacillus hordei DSM 19519 TaxID=1423759 RepID=A0A0R1MS86_9LACO|nr:site-specific integrase [Liquorilactobacillus hordei]KRL08034.1 phage integrase [Liquorilactobacillus hordei DSM 19519]QYH51022.1 site-specific integrase [Liquorilactobacillus hordei DSM 19519]